MVDLSIVLNNQDKIGLFHYICQLLPENKQDEFDDLASRQISKCLLMHTLSFKFIINSGWSYKSTGKISKTQAPNRPTISKTKKKLSQ